MSETKSLIPGNTIGILGGGQLGRMLALAGARLGLKTHVYCPDPVSPAFGVSNNSTTAHYEDVDSVKMFANAVDIVTYEFENIPNETIEELSKYAVVRPGIRPLAVSQDRLTEKQFLTELEIPISPYAQISNAEDIRTASQHMEFPAILKTRRFGYDGKGQTQVNSVSDSDTAWAQIGEVPAVLERKLEFIAECSLIAARGLNGDFAVYDMAENTHENHILKWSRVPATCLNAANREQAKDIGKSICDALDYIGILAVEMFVVDRGGNTELVVNEFAPRVHNSGHWTEDGCLISQFEQHIRAVAGWSLGTTEKIANIEMENLIGDDISRWSNILEDSTARLHVYGKDTVKPDRKMGHVNRLRPD